MWGPDHARSLELLVYGRNRDWMKMIEEELARGNAFIAVGGGHLVGDKGVVALLRAQGYRVRRVEI